VEALEGAADPLGPQHRPPPGPLLHPPPPPGPCTHGLPSDPSSPFSAALSLRFPTSLATDDTLTAGAEALQTLLYPSALAGPALAQEPSQEPGGTTGQAPSEADAGGGTEGVGRAGGWERDPGIGSRRS